ncbi:hypothetical protein MMC19_000215 [Ptychographa xylographoides]|nr:hypothetical protein [Ptychographa xylographoides]
MNTTSSSDPAFAFCIPAAPGTRFDIGACYNRTQGCSFFPNVPIDKCYKFCGDSFGYYDLPDVFGALTTWVIPLFSLLANMHFTDSTLEGLKWPCVSRILNHRLLKPFWSVIKPQLPKHFVCSVQLANPIGTIWSLAAKLHLGQQLWNHCKKCGLPLDAEGRKDITNLCYYLDDFGHELFEDRVNRLIQLLNNGTRLRKSAMVSQIAYRYVKETSRSLAFARVRNTRHTIFAVLVYIGMAISSLLTFTTSNGLDYSLPHTIALRELCFFILAQVILSSAVGAWSQQGAPQAITRKFALRIYEIETNLRDGQPGLWKHLASKEIALWDGGSYVFRPQKRKKSRARSVGEFSCENLNLGLLGVSCFIVIFAFVASFIISYSTPTKGIGGRGLAEILYIAIWILNFFIELWMTREIRGDDEHHRKQIFICTWLKDGIISLFGLLFFFLPFMGK